MAGFIPPHRQQQFLKASADFFSWWFDELVQLLPQKWRDTLSGQQASCRLIVEHGQLRLVLETQDGQTSLGSMHVLDFVQAGLSSSGITGGGDLSAQQELKASIARLDSEALGRVVLELSDDSLLIRDITLPLVGDSDIDRVLVHEIDRLSPFDKSNVCYSYEILQKNLQANKLRLRLICLERAVLEGLLEQCAELGLRVTQAQRITDLSRTGPLFETANLLPVEKRPLKEKVWSRANQLMAALAFALLLAVLILPLWHYEKQIDVLSEEVNALVEKSKKVRAKQARLVATLDIRDALVKRKNSEFEKIIILHNLTRVIPDNTWLNRIAIHGYSLEIEGESDKSSDLIEKLESEQAFYQVEFSSSVTRNSRTAKERFKIKMRLSDKPAKVPNTGVLTAGPDGEQQVAAGATAHE